MKINTDNNAHCDDTKFWKNVLIVSMDFGAQDATEGKHPLSGDDLINALNSKIGFFGYRNGHAKNLRYAYGAAYNGVKITKQAKTIASVAPEPWGTVGTR